VLTHEHGDDHTRPEPVKKRERTQDVKTPGTRAALHPLTVLRLQQSAGNAAVARLVAEGRAARPPGRRTEPDPTEERHRPDGTKPQPSQAAGARDQPEPLVRDPSPEEVPAGEEPHPPAVAAHGPMTTEAPSHPSPTRRDPGTPPRASAVETAQKTPARPGAHTVAGLRPLKVAAARPPSAPVAPALAPAAPVPTAEPAGSVDTATLSPGAEVGGEAEAPVRPGESDEELAHLDQQAEAGAPGGAAPTTLESAPQPEAAAPEPEAASPAPEVAADSTADAGPESEAADVGGHAASGASSAAGESAPSSGGDLEGLDASASPGPDPEAAEVQQEEQFQAQDAHAADGEAEADRGLAEASTQEAAEVAAESSSQGATAEASGEAAAADDTSGPAPMPADPSQVQAEAGAAVEAAGEDMSGASAADAAGGAAGGGGGGGGGEGGDSPPDTAPPPPPDLSRADPAQALAVAAALPPAQLAGSLDTVSAGASRTVAGQRAALVVSPPEIQRGAGAAGITAAPASPSGVQAVPKAADRSPVALRQPRPLPAARPAPVERARTPQIAETADGKVSPDAARNVQAAVRNLPTSDPGLAITPGAPPRLPLAGDADPQQVGEQQAHVDQTASQAAAQGQRDAAAPMGEDQIYPTVPATTLRGEVPAASGGAAPAAAASAVGATADSEAVSVIAQQEKGGEIRAAVTQGAAQITGARAEHTRQSAEERQRSAQEIAGLDRAHAQQQATERAQANTDVQAHRRQWTTEQAALVASHRTEASAVAGTARQSVIQEQTQAEQEAAAHHRAGEEEAGQARREGDQEAARARREGEQESSGGGFFGWVASAMKSLVDKVKNGIKAAFDKARAAVRAAIQKAQQLATAVIERARQAVVAAIRVAGAALIAIGDRLLAAFPAVRDRFRKAIQDRVKSAEAAVNRLAEGLERGVKSALDLLGKGLDAALGLLEKGMLAAVDAVKNAVQGALDFAKKAIEMLGTFAVIAKDIAKGPGRWLSMLGSAVVSGIRDHLWGTLKTAVKEWFNSKVEEVTGFGQMVWNLLKKGGISLAQVGKMVWQGVVAAIPGALFAILAEKLASMIVPAAGAVLAIIQGIQAAWGAIQRIIQAISAFVAFLKGVLGGSGPVLFAQALAAAAVAVIEFVAQWLLKKLKGAATGVGGKLREIAKRIGQRLKTIGKAVAGGARRAAGAAMRAVRAVGRGIARGAKAVGRGIARGARYIGRKLGRFGAAMGRGIRGAAAAAKKQWEKLKAKFREGREKLKKKWDDWKKAREERKTERAQEKLDRAVAALRPKVGELLSRGTTGLALKGRLLLWRIQHRLSSLSLRGSGNSVEIWAVVNPGKSVGDGFRLTGADLRRLVHEVSSELLERQEVRDAALRMRLTKARKSSHPIEITGAHDIPAAVRYLRERGQGLDISTPGGVRRLGPVSPRMWGDESYLFGSERARVREQRKQATNALTRGVGSYPEIANGLAETGMSDQRIASVIRAQITTGRLPRGLTEEQAALLRDTTWLMFVRESVRSPANLGFAAMTAELVHHGPKRGGITWQEGLAGYEGTEVPGERGLFPMSMKNAPRAARGVEAVEAGRHPGETYQGGTAVERGELIRREAELAERWALTVTGGVGIVSATEAAALMNGRQKITAHLLRFYGLH
jgi:hypothetical protein